MGVGGASDGRGADLVAGTSLKAALDLDWDDSTARDQALAQVLATLSQIAHWPDQQPADVARALLQVAMSDTYACQEISLSY